MRSGGRRHVHLIVMLLGTSCTSVPDAPRLSDELVSRIHAVHAPHFKAHVHCEPTNAQCDAICEKSLAEVKELLAASPWFESVDADRTEASLLIAVHPLDPTPHWHSPGHSPGMLILMLAIPIPWELRTGHRLTASVPESGASVQIDTYREPTALTWSLAPLLNLCPNRSFRPSAADELLHIHAQLLPLVEPVH